MEVFVVEEYYSSQGADFNEECSGGKVKLYKTTMNKLVGD